jgi:hypothetical protein
MKMPKQFVITTKDYIQIQTKLNLYIAKFGCKKVEAYLDSLPLRMHKQDGKNAGAYLINKICQEYKLSQYELFESNARKEITDARRMLCVLAYRHLDANQNEITSQFDRTRFFASRAINDITTKVKENHPLDKELVDRFKKLDALLSAYMGFRPKSKLK